MPGGWGGSGGRFQLAGDCFFRLQADPAGHDFAPFEKEQGGYPLYSGEAIREFSSIFILANFTGPSYSDAR